MGTDLGRNSPHIIMFACPMHGHCIPYIRLAKKLIAFGINFTFINLEHMISLMKATEEVQLLASDSTKFRLMSIPNGEGYKPSDSPLVLTNTLAERASGSFADCLERLMQGSTAVEPNSPEWGPPCCAIFDLFFCGSLVKIAYRFNLPSYSYWTTTATSLAVMMHVSVLRAQGHIPVNPEEADKLGLIDIPCLPPVHPFELIGALQRPSHVMHKLVSSYGDYHVQLCGILVNSVYELESSVFDALTEHYVGTPGSKLRSIIPVGPMIPKSAFLKEDHCENSENHLQKDPTLQWLDTQPPSSVIYVCFGSIATLSAAQVVELALGLEASGQRFVWVLKPPSDPSMVAASSEAYMYLPPGFEDRMKGTGIIVTNWAPQVQILQHPATGGYLMHCGWNSILESIGAGVPMLTWPIQAEQMLNARWLVEEVRAAVRMRRDPYTFVSRDNVEEAVKLLLCTEEGQIAKKNVSHLRGMLHSVFSDTSSSDKYLKGFVEDLHL